jgi:hypothetical protein
LLLPCGSELSSTKPNTVRIEDAATRARSFFFAIQMICGVPPCRLWKLSEASRFPQEAKNKSVRIKNFIAIAAELE